MKKKNEFMYKDDAFEWCVQKPQIEEEQEEYEIETPNGWMVMCFLLGLILLADTLFGYFHIVG